MANYTEQCPKCRRYHEPGESCQHCIDPDRFREALLEIEDLVALDYETASERLLRVVIREIKATLKEVLPSNDQGD